MGILIELPKATLQDIPHVLRCIAEEIESGAYGRIQMAAIVTEDDAGGIRTFGAGGADFYRAMALFNLGVANLITKRRPEAML